MEPIRRLFREIHRRSIWQVLGVYLVASWVAIEVVTTLTEALGLPAWFPAFAVVLLLMGLPIVLATAIVQHGVARARPGDPAPPESAAGASVPSGVEAPAAQPHASVVAPRRLFTWRNAIGGGVLAFALWGVVAAGWLLFGGGAGRDAGSNVAADDSPGNTIAVLPFANMSPDADNAFFAGGIHEEILTNLARISGLTVISRTSVLPYRASGKPVDEIAAELGADVVLEGSVQKVGDRVRITTQLIDADTDAHLWAERYDRTIDDVFELQTDIAQRIAGALQVRLLPAEAERLARTPTADADAYELYLKGLDLLRQSNMEGPTRAALEAFEAAVDRDPEFAEAHAGLAQGNVDLYWFGYDVTPARLALARQAAERAIALDPEALAGRLALGDVLYTSRDFDAALEQLAPLVGQNPNNARAAFMAAAAYRRRSEWAPALRLFERAVELDPLSGVKRYNLGATLQWLGRHPEAEVEFRRAITLAPEQGFGPHLMLAVVRLCRTGRVAEARRVLEAAPASVQPELVPYVALVFGTHRPEPDLAMLREFPDPVASNQVHLAPTALLEALLLERLGRGGESRVLADSARLMLEAMARRRPDDPRIYNALARADLLLGRTEDAVRAAQRNLELLEADAMGRPGARLDLARLLAQTGEEDRAVALLERLWADPGWVCRPIVAQDPAFETLRGHPGFDALLAREMEAPSIGAGAGGRGA